jgi:hypothetical protein
VLRSRLADVRRRRDLTLDVYTTSGLINRNYTRSLSRQLHQLDSRIDRLWERWLQSTLPSGPASRSAERVPFDWDEAQLALLTSRPQRWRDRLLTLSLGVTLAVLVVCLVWANDSGETGAYVGAFAAAAASTVLVLLRMRGASRREIAWALTSLPLLVLAGALTYMVWDADARTHEQAALGTSLLLLLGAISLIAVVIDTAPGVQPVILTRAVEIPDDLPGQEYAQRLGEYLERLRVVVLREGVAQRRLGERWNRAFLIVGGLAAALSALAGFTGLSSEEFQMWVAVLALIGAGLTAFVTLINPAGRAEKARLIGLSCGSLAEQINQLIQLDLVKEFKGKKLDDIRAQVEAISAEFDVLREVPQRTRLWETTELAGAGAATNVSAAQPR